MATRSDTEQRTEQPTAGRLAEARGKGQVARSADLTGVAVVSAATASLWLGGDALLRSLTEMLAGMLGFELSAPDAQNAFGEAVWSHASPVALIAICSFGVMALAAIVAGVAQVGLHVSSEVAKPRLDRLSPGQGLRRVFSARSLVRAMQAIAKMSAVGFVAWMTVSDLLPRIASDCGSSVRDQWSGAWVMLGQMAWRVALVLLVLASIDWLWQWRRHRNDLMMTRREVLEDLRRTEGDPLMRAKMRRARQAEIHDSPDQTGDES